MTTQQLYLFNGFYLIVFVVVVVLTRANMRRIAGALAGGTAGGVVGAGLIALWETVGWWHFVIPLDPYFQAVLWIGVPLMGFSFVVHIGKRVEAILAPEPTHRQNRVTRLSHLTGVSHDGRVGNRLRTVPVVIVKGELDQAAPAKLPAVAARFVAIAETAGVNIVRDFLGLPVILLRKSVRWESPGPDLA